MVALAKEGKKLWVVELRVELNLALGFRGWGLRGRVESLGW